MTIIAKETNFGSIFKTDICVRACVRICACACMYILLNYKSYVHNYTIYTNRVSDLE